MALARATKGASPRKIEAEVRVCETEFTALVERDGAWYIAYSPEIPGANGQGKTKSAALKSLAIRLPSSSRIGVRMGFGAYPRGRVGRRSS